MFDECAVARDSVGFLGTVPQCITYLNARAEAAEAALDDAVKWVATSI